MSLREYERKRRFEQTPEPSAGRQRRRRGHEPIFVVQLHHARARHYDFRLEADGVLKSWAVPKGPSMRVGERRLAVEVEDHPLDYATFEGDIPEGHYGAGHVDIFDHGTWSTEDDPLEQIAAGNLDFELEGDRLKGGFKLVRMRMKEGKPQWLLMKSRDRFARDADADSLLKSPKRRARARTASASLRTTSSEASKAPAAKRTAAGKRTANAAAWKSKAVAAAGRDAVAPMPERVELELALLRPQPPEGEGWQHEVKWDGYRMLAYVTSRRVRLQSRNRLDWSGDFPPITRALKSLVGSTSAPSSLVLDGELVALDEKGRSDFALLQRELHADRRGALRYLVFDLLYVGGVDLRGAPLVARRELLRDVLALQKAPAIAFSEHVTGSGRKVLDASLKAGLEGIISKRIDSPYRGGRTGDWIKTKGAVSEDYAVVGYTEPKGSRAGFGSLLLAARSGRQWRYAGRVGSGFTQQVLDDLGKRLRALRVQDAVVELPAHVPFSHRSVHWVRPEIVVEVHLRGRGKEGLVRQASFVRVRDDKPLKDVETIMSDTNKGVRKGARGVTRSTTSKASPARGESQRLTSPERVVYPDAGITKGEIAAYYGAVADWLLPELVKRPLSLLRCPEGVGGTCFFQKHHAPSLGKSVHAIELRETQGSDEYVYVRDIRGVLELVQMNTIEFHPWGARVDNPERPDRVVFDLDPGEDVAWSVVKAAARDVHERLAAVGLQSWVRLSGGKGVHVVVPMRRGPGWDDVKDFCGAFAGVMAAREPLRYIATATKKERKGRIFIDWLRNARGATSVANWSLRARAGAPVVMPLTWAELGRTRSGADYDLHKALRRAGTLKADPWEGFATTQQRLPRMH